MQCHPEIDERAAPASQTVVRRGPHQEIEGRSVLDRRIAAGGPADNVLRAGLEHGRPPLDRAMPILQGCAGADRRTLERLEHAIAGRGGISVGGDGRGIGPVGGLGQSGVGRACGRLRAHISDRRTIDHGFGDAIAWVSGRECADHPAAQIAQDRGHIAPGKIGAAAIVDAVAAGELGHIDRRQLERVGCVHVPAEEAAPVPAARLAGDHTIGADARHGDGKL